MKTLKLIVLSLVLFLALPTSLAIAESECRGSVLEAQEVSITPESECLSVEILDSDCFRSIDVKFTNGCGQNVEVRRTSPLEEFEEFMKQIAPKKAEQDYLQYEENIAKSVSYEAIIGEETLEIKIDFTASTEESRTDSACSSVGTGGFSFLLLGFGLVFVRRRSRK